MILREIVLPAKFLAYIFSLAEALARAEAHITPAVFLLGLLATLQEGPIWPLLQILPLLKHSVTGGVDPLGNKGMPEA